LILREQLVGGNTSVINVLLKTDNMFSNRSTAEQQEAAGTEHIEGLYRYAVMLTRNQSDAEDLVQETYVRALPAMGNLREGSNIKSWLFTILRNAWLNQWRRNRSQARLLDHDGKDDGTSNLVATSKDPYEEYVSKTECSRVREAIERLPAEFREIIALREFEGLSYHEIAAILDCPPGTVMSRLARARSKLRILLTTTTNSRLPSVGEDTK
jgi:RNA polymerase sigma-70 factor (ECF subfamily)